jgi:hypothetical protein
MKSRQLSTSWVLLLVALLASAGPAWADVIFTVNVNTTPLVGGPFAVAFQLNDGSGSGDANNTATISNFTFGGGSASGCPANCTTTGGASGDMTGTVTLTDSSFFNSFAEQFTAGTSLSFQVDLTTNLDAGGTPDAFAFSILDNGVSIPTLDPLGADTLLSVDIDAANPAILTYATDPSRTNISLEAPVIGTPPSSVPAPGTLLLIITGLAGAVGIGRRRLTG